MTTQEETPEQKGRFLIEIRDIDSNRVERFMWNMNYSPLEVFLIRLRDALMLLTKEYRNGK